MLGLAGQIVALNPRAFTDRPGRSRPQPRWGVPTAGLGCARLISVVAQRFRAAADRPRVDHAGARTCSAVSASPRSSGCPVSAFYLLVRILGMNASVEPAELYDTWWRIPVLLMVAFANGWAEEVIVVGFLITRLRQLRVSPLAAVVASSVLRGVYHLYQGFGAGLGNLAMGLVFGYVYLRTGRLWPLIIAHGLIDCGGVRRIRVGGRPPELAAIALGYTYILAVDDNRQPPPRLRPAVSPGAVAGDPARSQLPPAAVVAAQPAKSPTAATTDRRRPPPPPPPAEATPLHRASQQHRRPRRLSPAIPSGSAPEAEKASAQTLLGPHPGCVDTPDRHRSGGRRLLDGLVAASDRCTGRLSGAPRAGRRHHMAAGRIRQPPESESRAAGGVVDRRRLGTGRTDTILLVHIPHSGRDTPTTMVSIPRDSYVEIPGYGQDKINAAFVEGGAPLLAQTVEQATGLRLDHYAEIGFDGFALMVDAVGGVTMCPTEPIDDPLAGINLPAGCQELDGRNALGYVRTRATPRADLDRMINQRAFMSALLHRATSPAVWLNPLRWYPMAHAAGRRDHRRRAGPHLGCRHGCCGRCTETSRRRPCRSVSSPVATRVRSWCGTATSPSQLFTALGNDSPVPQDVLDAVPVGA